MLSFTLCSSAAFGSAPPDTSACINAHFDQVIDGTIVALDGNNFTLRVKRVLLGAYNSNLYAGTLLKTSDSCSSLGPYGFQLKVSDRLIVYSSRVDGTMTPSLWLDPNMVFVFDQRYRAEFPQLQRQQDKLQRRRAKDRRALARSLGGAVPRGSRGYWITDADYPFISAQKGAEGLVRVQLNITPEGRVGKCKILRSSGDLDLDATTCAAYTRRGRFQRPQSVYETKATLDHMWRLPEKLRAATRRMPPAR
jgi:TonB family protein